MNLPADLAPADALRRIEPLLSPPVHVVRPEASLAEMAARLARDARSHTLHVTTEEGFPLGVVPFRALRRAVHVRAGVRLPGLAGHAQRLWHADARTAEDLLVRVRPARAETSLADALLEMDVARIADLPVVDRHGVLRRELTHHAHARLLDALLPR